MMSYPRPGWIGLLIVLATAVAAAATSAPPVPFEVRGVNLTHLHRRGFGYGSEECRKQLKAIADLGANWVALNDFAYMDRVDRPAVRFDRDGSLTPADLDRCIRDAHAAGLKVMLKPHIWSREFWNGSKWHGDIKMTSEADWDTWFSQYTAYILYEAKMAAQTHAEALCVGVEYEGTSGQEARWRKLIATVRQAYPGIITYACAMGEWPHVKWLDALDCVGIDAYFPLTNKEDASEEDLRRGWAKIYHDLEPFIQKWGGQVCFTELGYSDSSKAGIEPWAYDVVKPNPAYQARLYKVAIEEAAKHPYAKGMFIWKWFTSDQFRKIEHRDPFAMQDRPAVLKVLRDAWGMNKPAPATQP
jgi:hypothetical protein